MNRLSRVFGAASACLLIGCGSLLAFDVEDPEPAPAPGPEADAGSAGDALDPAAARLVFVLDARRDADEIDELMSDAHCTAELQKVKPGASAIAWVTLPSGGPLTRLGSSSGPWVSLQGDVVFPSRDDFARGPLRGIDWTIDAETPRETTLWTGTNPDGTPGATCRNWETQGTADRALVGRVGATGTSWTADTEVDCEGVGGVLCFEQ